MIYLFNPLVGLPLQPVLGQWSDQFLEKKETSCRCSFSRGFGRRRPFILALAVLAFVNFGVLAWSDSQQAAGLFGSARAVVVLTFVAFNLVDTAHDLLLVPGRALAIDCLGDSDATDSLYTACQLGGRLLALCVGSLQLNAVVGGVVLSHFQVLLMTSMGVMVVSAGAALVAGTGDDGQGIRRNGDIQNCNNDDAVVDKKTGSGETASLLPFPVHEKTGESRPEEEEDSACGAASDSTGASTGGASTSTGGASTSTEPSPELSRSTLAQWCLLSPKQRRGLAILLAVQFLGWTCFNGLCFWFTEWVGLETKVGLLPTSLPVLSSLRLAFVSLVSSPPHTIQSSPRIRIPSE
jgi:solute carrier family 45 protein 1/2/4